MAEKLLCQVEERRQIAGRGLTILPNFSAAKADALTDYKTSIEVETANGKRRTFEAHFMTEHFSYSDPSVPIDKRWRIVLYIPKAKKEEVPIGSKLFVSLTDYSKISGNDNP
jgi:hypothetical protein